MRRRRIIEYRVEVDGLWWTPEGRWVRAPVGRASSVRHFRTCLRAWRHALAMARQGHEVMVIRVWRHRGKRRALDWLVKLKE